MPLASCHMKFLTQWRVAQVKRQDTVAREQDTCSLKLAQQVIMRQEYSVITCCRLEVVPRAETDILIAGSKFDSQVDTYYNFHSILYFLILKK